MKKTSSHRQRLIKDMLAAGCLLTVAGSDRLPDLTIACLADGQSVAYLFRDRTEYVFHVRISNRSYALLKLLAVECHSPGDWDFIANGGSTDEDLSSESESFIWLGERGGSKEFRFPSGRNFALAEVLNPWIKAGGELAPGESRIGYLLGLRMGRNAQQAGIRESGIPMQLSISDNYRRKHRSVIEIAIDRASLIKLPTRLRTGAGLYEPQEHVSISPPEAIVQPRNNIEHADPATLLNDYIPH